MTAIQAVYVRGHEERPEPKPHVVFRIEIQAHVRSWNMWRRYSEFLDLHTELTKSTGAPPPAPLPPKHALAMLRSRTDEARLEERRLGLEAYLRAIVGAKDDRWRDSFALRDFLGVPVGKQAVAGGSSSSGGGGGCGGGGHGGCGEPSFAGGSWTTGRFSGGWGLLGALDESLEVAAVGGALVVDDAEVLVEGELRAVGGAPEVALGVGVCAGAVGGVPLALDNDADELLLARVHDELVLAGAIPGHRGPDEARLVHCAG